MRIILKLLAAPFVLSLTLIVAILSFSVFLVSLIFDTLSFIFTVYDLFELFIQSNPQ